MGGWNQGSWKSLWLPGGVLLAAASLLLRGGLVKISPSTLDFYFYSVFGCGLLLAWRFHAGRVFSAAVLLLLAQRTLVFFSGGRVPIAGPGLTALEAVSFLLPLNLLLLAMAREQGFTLPAFAPRMGWLFLQAVFVAVICRPQPAPGAHLFHVALVNPGWFSWTRIPQISILTTALVCGFLLTRSLLQLKPTDAGFAWAVLCAAFAFGSSGVGTVANGYFATAAFIMVVSLVETSYRMAYYDELTGIPGRRACNDAMLQLSNQYAVAVVDIDHFKNFNDTYGHDMGDEVLRMVAGNLARVTGGGSAFRTGGEEFIVLFPGKAAQEAREHLEAVRTAIETADFRVRGSERRAMPRGPERRQGSALRQRGRRQNVAMLSSPDALRVTVSIGLAEPSVRTRDTEGVIAAADEALYQAKANGRNRLELAPGTGMRAPGSRTKKKRKKAGIA